MITRKLKGSCDLRYLLEIFHEELLVREKCVLSQVSVEKNKPATVPQDATRTRFTYRNQQATAATLYTGSQAYDRKHHSTICECYSKAGTSERGNEADQKRSSVEAKVPESTSTTNMHVSARNSVLLQTARADVKAPGKARGRRLRFVFDSGSQKSYVTEKARLPEEKLSDTSLLKNDSEKPEESKVLGMIWNSKSDELAYDFDAMLGSSEKEQVTKRDVLATTAKIFDPLGLISPVIVPLKLVFQQLCKQTNDWNSLIDESILSDYKAIVNDLMHVGRIVVDRNYIGRNIAQSDIDFIELHGFCDASKASYGACVYVFCHLMSFGGRVPSF
eukprot:Seg496.1 transcript_id=Seg496.1/GoldUCD/mRNA.D3Y31 product="hypothetical protein" protein_id=Seg496.1/GoldUCD/D3Y31